MSRSRNAGASQEKDGMWGKGRLSCGGQKRESSRVDNRKENQEGTARVC